MNVDRRRLRPLPLGSIVAQGWLADQLRLQADGQTGRLPDVWPDVGPDSGWLGGSGERWERGPYYLDGLVPLAFGLDDDRLQQQARPWLDRMFAGQRADGWFGPDGNDDWWPRMVAAKVATQWAEATGDPRVEPFLARYFAFQAENLARRPLSGWGRARGADNVLSILWLYDRTGDAGLLDLARLVLDQTTDWPAVIADELPVGPAPTFRHEHHGVNVAMGLKTVVLAALVDHRSGADPAATTASMLDALDRLHGLVHGTFSGDEWLGGREPQAGVETCLVVELMFSYEVIISVLGDGTYADRLEEVGYNLLAAANDPRMLAHQYHQQANQVACTFAPRDWSFSGPDANVFGLEPHFGCCTANLHQGWPKLVSSLWLTDPTGDTLTASAYGPCRVQTSLAGRAVTLDVVTDYPFDETIMITVGVTGPTEFGLRLRIPRWCADPELTVAGVPVAVETDDDGYLTVRRDWSDGDVVGLRLPMILRVLSRDRGAVGLRFGPLVLVDAVAEVWRPVPGPVGLAEWEITPRGPWNHGLWLDDPAGVASWPVTRRPIGPVPFDVDAVPVEITGRGAMIRDWRLEHDSAASPPTGPVPTSMPLQSLRLLPYGSARLRVAELPTVTPEWLDES